MSVTKPPHEDGGARAAAALKPVLDTLLDATERDVRTLEGQTLLELLLAEPLPIAELARRMRTGREPVVAAARKLAAADVVRLDGSGEGATAHLGPAVLGRLDAEAVRRLRRVLGRLTVDERSAFKDALLVLADETARQPPWPRA